MLKRRSKTCSRSFTGYIIDSYGNQVKLFQTFDSSEVDSLCKEYTLKLPYSTRIYVEELFVLHYISTFKL